MLKVLKAREVGGHVVAEVLENVGHACRQHLIGQGPELGVDSLGVPLGQIQTLALPQRVVCGLLGWELLGDGLANHPGSQSQ